MCLDVFLFQSVWSRRLLHVSMHGNSAKGPSPQTRRSSTGIAMCHRDIIPGWYLYEYIMDIYIYFKGWFLYDISWKWNIIIYEYISWKWNSHKYSIHDIYIMRHACEKSWFFQNSMSIYWLVRFARNHHYNYGLLMSCGKAEYLQ